MVDTPGRGPGSLKTTVRVQISGPALFFLERKNMITIDNVCEKNVNAVRASLMQYYILDNDTAMRAASIVNGGYFPKDSSYDTSPEEIEDELAQFLYRLCLRRSGFTAKDGTLQKRF